MSDLGGGPTTGAVGNGRPQNGASRVASGPGPTPQYPSSGARAPTEIMRQRRLRDEKKKAENEAKQREQDEEERRRIQEEMLNQDRRTVVGVAPVNVGGEDRSGHRRPEVLAAKKIEDSSIPGVTERPPPERGSGGSIKANQPAPTQPSMHASRSSRLDTTSGVPPGTADAPTGTFTRQRASTVSQGQPRPVQQQQAQRAASHSTQRQAQTRQTSSAAVNSKEQGDPSAPAPGFRPQASQETAGASQGRNTNTSSFPHAFERWETLSSHWEGLTSYWMRRLEQNSDEVNREPLNQQLARQVTDLSAAGANLFHAVVELQRLRASSERKFQRWFFETRAEQERAQEVHAGMEGTLRIERQARADAVADVARMETEKNTAYQMKTTAEQMVKEMRRELQISKEEARRAWEELGRREQEERDRTTSLRNGEPTLVGGVQVVPMMQGAPSRQESSNRPSTREGPYTSGGNASSSAPGNLGPESSLEEDPGYTTYDPTRSETDTDPFTEGGRTGAAQRGQFASSLATPTSQPLQQTSNGTTTTTTTVPGAAVSPPRQQPNSLPGYSTPTSAATGSTYLRYGPGVPVGQPATSFYQHAAPTLHQDDRPQPRTTEPDERSYVQSVDTVSEDSYELNDNGEVRRDAQGRPINVRGGPGSEDSDEYDVGDQLERERMYGQSYGSGMSGVEYGHGPTTAISGAPSARSGVTHATAAASSGAPTAPVDYSGSDYGSGLGWEAVPRHHHPTRLSDVLEEDERSRTSPSRASQTSRGLR